MMRSLWTAASGMIGEQSNLDVIANNLSNINTTEIKLKEAETYEVESFETNGTKMNVVKVCEKRIKPLLKDSVDQIKSTLMENVFPESKF